jgi:hypothetical protein
MTQKWHIEATYRRPADITDDLRDEFTFAFPGFSIITDDGQKWITATGDVEADDINQACSTALAATRAAWAAAFGDEVDPVALRVAPMQVHLDGLGSHALDLIGITEVGQILGTSKQRASQIVDQADFPAALAHPAMGRVYSRAAVERFAQTWTRRRARTADETIG